MRCLYAFSGFTVYNVFFNHFVDVVALFPYLLCRRWTRPFTMHRRELVCILGGGEPCSTTTFFFVGQVVFLAIYFICKAQRRRLSG